MLGGVAVTALCTGIVVGTAACTGDPVNGFTQELGGAPEIYDPSPQSSNGRSILCFAITAEKRFCQRIDSVRFVVPR